MTERRVIDLSRRQFLRGAGGAVLALPVLSSLFVEKAYGADPLLLRKPRLFWLTTDHGGAEEDAFFPAMSAEPRSLSIFEGHAARASSLVAAHSSGRARLSPILEADAALLPERRVQQLNVLRGLDIPFSIAHHTGGHLGNYAVNDALAGPGAEARMSPRPSIDQLLAWSQRFYTDLSAVRERALVMGTRAISYAFSSPAQGSGAIQNVLGTDSSLALFDRVLGGGDGAASNGAIVDGVLDAYKRLRNGHRRLSSLDRQRLDDHMDRIAELQRKLQAAPLAAGSLARPMDDSAAHLTLDPSDAARYAQLFSEVAAAAFIAGASRIAVLGLGDAQRFARFTGDWHAEVAHEWRAPDKQALLATSYQRIFEQVFLDIAQKLDVEEAGGFSYLDNALVVWSQESGMSTHDPLSIPVLTAGSAAGYFTTGQGVDYRRLDHPDSRSDPQHDGRLQWAGVTYNQLLATALQAMGLAREDFELWGHRGYGVPIVDPRGHGILPFDTHYRDSGSRYFEIASEPLPFLKA